MEWISTKISFPKATELIGKMSFIGRILMNQKKIRVMEQYISKSALITEIEKLEKQCCYSKSDATLIAKSVFDSIKDIINTQEVKEENDSENLFQSLPFQIADEKSNQLYELSIYHYDGQCVVDVVDYVGEIDQDSFYTFRGSTLYEATQKAWNWLFKNSTEG